MTDTIDAATFQIWRARNRPAADRFLIWIGDLTGVPPRLIRSSSLDGLELSVECYKYPLRPNAAQNGAETYVRVFQLDAPPPVWLDLS